MNRLLVNECFLSCQGEGAESGLPTVFVRLQGCNLTCPWCDSKHTWGWSSKESWNPTVADLVSQIISIDKCHSSRVYLTGGEPLMQDIEELVQTLDEEWYKVTIATNGTLPRPSWWKQAHWDIDYKCPSSGCNYFDQSWLTSGRVNQLKFVVANQEDLEFTKQTIQCNQNIPMIIHPSILVSPVMDWDQGQSYNQAQIQNQEWLQEVWKFCAEYNLRYSLQCHKIVFGDRRGV